MAAREGEAPLEAEALDAVRLMTIHRAKGLEFPVVCVADLGKDGRDDDDALRITDDGSVGLRLASLGGGAMDIERLERIKEEQKRRRRRRSGGSSTCHDARRGAAGAERRDRPRERPGAARPREPMRWLWRGFAPGCPARARRGARRPLRGRRGRRWLLDTTDELRRATGRRRRRAEDGRGPARSAGARSARGRAARCR